MVILLALCHLAELLLDLVWGLLDQLVLEVPGRNEAVVTVSHLNLNIIHTDEEFNEHKTIS
jgi:hypothetical protein